MNFFESLARVACVALFGAIIATPFIWLVLFLLGQYGQNVWIAFFVSTIMGAPATYICWREITWEERR